MLVFNLFKNRVLIAATIVVVGASLTRADQNDKNKNNNRGDNRSSSSSRSTNSGSSNNGPSVRSLSNGGGGNSSSRSSNNDSGRSLRNFSNSNNSNSQNFSRGNDSSNSSRLMRDNSHNDSDNGARSFQSGNNRSRVTGDANIGDAGQARAFFKQNNSVNQSQQGNAKGATNGQQAVNNSQQGPQKIQTMRPTDNQVRNFLQLKNNENTRVAENDDHRNKGDNGRNQNNQNNNSNGRQAQGGNPGSKNGGQSNNGQNQNGQNQGNVQGNGGPQFFKRGDLNSKNSNRDNNSNHDKDFKFGDHHNDGDHRNDRDGKHDDHTTVKDLFDHNKGVGSGHGPDQKFRDRDFHGNDSAKVEFKKWNDVWKGKSGNGKDNRDWSGKWRSGDRFVVADSIRHDFFGHHDIHHMPFQGNWWSGNHHHGWGFWGDYAVHRHRPWYWWNWSTCPELTTYCGFGWNTPYYWDYGPGEYIYCNDGMVYVNGRIYEPVPVFYAQTVRMIDQAPLLDADAAAEADWMPLGVFAVTPDGMNQPTMLVQLAITKAGILGGTATDQQAGVSFNIQGTVDKNSQRAVWSYVDANNQRIVMETSINNLTQNESTGLIHYNANDQKVVEFVRLPDPNGQPGDLPGPGAGLVIPPAGGQLPPPEEQ